MLVNRVGPWSLVLFLMADLALAKGLIPDLYPDRYKDHCNAFSGQWKNGTCENRYEYQQKPVARDYQQFCEARGGTYVEQNSRRGLRRTCQNAQSKQGLDHYPYHEFANSDLYLDVERSCLIAEYSLKDCKVADSQEVGEWFDYTHAPPYGSTAYNLAMEATLDGLANLKKNQYGEMLRRNIGAALYAKMRKENLNSCQKACLTKCATAAILEYDHQIGSGPHPYSTEYLYTHRKGVCTEYSRLNKDLGDLTGTNIAMRGTLKGRHSYNYYKINGRWYYGEPQNKLCRFFHSKSTLKSYQAALTSYDGGWTEILPAPKRSRRAH